ncbi:PREDICTED: phosphatidylinositol 3-kinase catalytic subunit type 3 [Papilio polytes]|uniref:phosphatidylinositol 3-kinase catalytic subunit type 3 n=1 Tax=Papilio polytes TaxID=76194 RepID=UPI000675F9B6|nr:PREDICTED: phosphatidylinositol 3-kinase catalytic subunit type 3 [Papilio polytes]
MNEIDDKFYYVYSSSLDHKVEIKIGTLEGKRAKPEYDKLLSDPMLKFSGLYQEGCSDLYVTCQVLCDGLPLALPVTTSYKAFTNRWNWNEWITLPVFFSDLPRNAILAMTIYDCAGPGKVMIVGGTTISLFGKHGMLRQGMFDLRVWPGVEGSERTPGKAPDRGKEQMQKLAKLAKKHRNGHMPKVDWLDRLTFREIEMINEKEKRSSDYMYLMIEFPTVQIDGINHAVVYYEQDGDEMYQFRAQAEIVTVPDYEILQENLVESKQHRLARCVRGAWGREAKPTARERDHLAALVAAPPRRALAADDQDLVWKYRFYLSSHRRALTKFLECVNWNRPAEVRQALAMMKQWAPMDVEDALELLTPKFTHPAVRRYAISRLRQAPDEDLLLYLLQLVQALKYEDFAEIHSEYLRVCGKDAVLAECEGLMQSTRQNPTASVLTSSDMTASTTSRQSNEPPEESTSHEDPFKCDEGLGEGAGEGEGEGGGESCSLAGFLIGRACGDAVVANYLYWYLLIECEDAECGAPRPPRHMYLSVMKTFSQRLAKGNADHQRTRSFLARQQVFIDKLVKLVKTVARESGNRNKKAERLQQLLADPDAFKFNFTNFEPMPFPLDPSVTIKGIVAKKASLFKSALMPSKLTFLTTEGVEYEAIFKHGDDLRQDQLILQMITLMDKLLRRLKTSLPNTGLDYFISYLQTGVGDRHLDNLLLRRCGALFHIDFGYILGRDPKPLPPPMKLSREMVEAMGGVHADHYHEFRKLCYTAFLHLRRHANLMLNLFSLMVDASVPDIALEPDKAVKKVQDKLRLDLGDEEAVHYFQNLLDMSVTAVMAVLVEHFHKFAQYWRK